MRKTNLAPTFSRSHRSPQKGYRRLFINLGKADGFYPGEVMQFINKHVRGHVEVGHIDLLDKISYIEVPEKEAALVMRSLDGTRYKRRAVRCNEADSDSRERGNEGARKRGNERARGKGEAFGRGARGGQRSFKKEDWMRFLHPDKMKLKGEEPDFSEEGWARRRPKKK